MTTQQSLPRLLVKNALPTNGIRQPLFSKKQQILSFIDEKIASLNDNWDGYGGSPIEKNVLIQLTFLIDKMPNTLINALSTEAILPNPNGTISIEWSSNTHEVFLEIGNHYATYYIKNDGKMEISNNRFILSNSIEFRQFLKYLKSYFLA